MFQRLTARLAACFALAVPCAACTVASTSGAPGKVWSPERGDKAITVGSLLFTTDPGRPAQRDPNARAGFRGQAARSVADGWLRAQALRPEGRGPQ
jgi:hypothetical protein